MQKNSVKVSMAVVRRLPKYYRYLGDLIQNGVMRISSKELGKLMGLTASQIRQDLNCFGGFGQQGYGYNVEELQKEIGRILGLNQTYNCVIVGAGNLGQAIANYEGFRREGFALSAMFDVNPRLIGNTIRDIKIYDIQDLGTYVLENDIQLGIICVPKEQSQGVADTMMENGIKAIWNFAPADVQVRDNVVIENVAISESLYTLTYLMNEPQLEI
ncbi:redox-sensing transcriptional repressor Rex [Alkalibacter rhizosphaerae]|uniref:Redox-sensing transcriptional repressor Rex n=1 Tax=Alkalibacter rhizosphaerae TaxID=2815577 RepID=A0A974XE18_9FIRM|nr:redox-sensing transcriptional repressor Rex [Alkalibacter rhizosphaerae]QSX08021.1 redox-sensing transcriptional repressor Rex [Alkalibacter rhizosphaerae]